MPDISTALETYQTRPTHESRDELILRSMPLVRYVVKRYAGRAPRFLDRDDLIDSGVCGLIEAVERFDPAKNVKFETYAILRIKGAVLDELRSRDWAPRSARRRAREFEEVCAKLDHEDDGSLDPDKVAKALGLSQEEMRQRMSQVSFVAFVSIDEDQPGADSETTLLARLPDDRSPDPSGPIQFHEKKLALMAAIQELDKQQKLVITLYYFEGLLLKDIAGLLHVTESRVSQIHTRGLDTLKQKMREFV